MLSGQEIRFETFFPELLAAFTEYADAILDDVDGPWDDYTTPAYRAGGSLYVYAVRHIYQHPEDLLFRQRYFGFLNRLADSADPDVTNLLIVSFVEGYSTEIRAETTLANDNLLRIVEKYDNYSWDQA